MDLVEFRTAYLHLVSLIIKYKQTVGQMPIMPKEKPGYFRRLLPESAPNEPESFFGILKDLEQIIIPNLLHWDHPNFYAYFACGSGYPSVLAEILIAGLGNIAFSWGMCPAILELEHIATDMFGRLLNLPEFVLYAESKGKGGGMLMNSASEAIYQAMLIARNSTLKMLQEKNKSKNLFYNLNKLVAYCSKEAHSSVEKAASLQQVKIRLLDVLDTDFSMDLKKLKDQLQKDIADGLQPFFLVSVFGSTGTAAMDDLKELQAILEQHPDIWYHFDGAYGGSAFVLPEYKHLLEHIKRINSINVNPYKWALTAPCGSCIWFKNRELVRQIVTPEHLKYFKMDSPLNTGLEIETLTQTRKFRALRLYMNLRCYGKKGLQRYVKNHIVLTKRFENYIKNDPLFVLVNKVHFSLVCFRVKETEKATSEVLTKELISRLNDSVKIHLTPSAANNIFFIRVCVIYEEATEKLIDNCFEMIRCMTHKVLNDLSFTTYPEKYCFTINTDGSNRRRSIDFDSIILSPVNSSKNNNLI